MTHSDLRSPQRRQRYSVGILLDLVEPDVARAARRSSPAGRWLSGVVGNPRSGAEHHVLVLLSPGVRQG